MDTPSFLNIELETIIYLILGRKYFGKVTFIKKNISLYTTINQEKCLLFAINI